MHHGRLNQYSFMHHDTKIVLHPISPEAIRHDDAQIANHIAAKDSKNMRRHIATL
jgi:hypothetical protein